MAQRVFVVRELFPFTAGGIGRVAANILATSTPEELRQTAVVYLASGLTAKRFNSVYPGVRFVDASPNTYRTVDREGRRYPPSSAYTDTMLHGESVRAMQALARLEAEVGSLRYIEFGDWGGNAFATCQEKLLGRGFRSATIAVRLHSTDSVLGMVEGRHSDIHALCLYDLERKALADCDLIVAQLESVADRMKSFYGFADADWDERVVVHAPPVLLDRGDVVAKAIEVTDDTPIVFSSKLQRLKRPDVFVRGCVAFMRARPSYTGEAVFLAHAFDASYQASIERLIPWDLRTRFRFVGSATQEERAATIARSVCVFPTIWESFCLAAYEASMTGARCVVNAANPAFSEHTPWVDGRNCEKFDGSAEDLARCLTSTFERGREPLDVAQAPKGVMPWTTVPPVPRAAQDAAEPLVSVIISHYNLGAFIHRTVDSVLTSTYSNVEIVIVDDASTESVSLATIQKLADLEDERLRVVRAPFNRGLAATRNAAIEHCRGDFILPLDADDLIGPDFIRSAVYALSHHEAYDIVVPQVAYFSDDMEGTLHTREELENCYVFVGEARSSGLHQNRFSTATMLVRRKVLERLRYREELVAYEDWDLYLRAVMDGVRFIVTSDVGFFYRVRSDSMIHSPEGRAQHRLAYHDILRDKMMSVGGMSLPLYAIEGFAMDGASVVIGGGNAELRARLDAYENSEVVRASLIIARQVQRFVPWMLPIGKRIARFIYRLTRRLARQ
jgi:glycosyltransferase involved in cell wall biosynthesis